MSALSSSGILALVGGNEFRPNCEEMDQGLLALAGRKPKVVIIPTAAAHERPELAAENGMQYFRKLGAQAEAAMVVDSTTARDPREIAKIRDADILYFTGGDPRYLLRTLRDSMAWKAVAEVWRNGRMVAGSSSGAMILGGKMWAPGNGWDDGLGLAPDVAVIPHHASLAKRWDAFRMKSSLPEGIALVGIDEATALVGPPWQVLGIGQVAIYDHEKPKLFQSGERVLLNA